MNHVIVFGGTGMLAGATSWLASQADHTVVFARNKNKAEKVSERVTAIELDYTNTEALKARIAKAIQENGPVDLVLAWIHGTAPHAVEIIIEEILKLQDKEWRFVHVKGSSQNRESVESEQLSTKEGAFFYQEVKLGFVLDNIRSRWLSHREIAAGTIKAIQEDVGSHTIGTLTPWNKRP